MSVLSKLLPIREVAGAVQALLGKAVDATPEGIKTSEGQSFAGLVTVVLLRAPKLVYPDNILEAGLYALLFVGWMVYAAQRTKFKCAAIAASAYTPDTEDEDVALGFNATSGA